MSPRIRLHPTAVLPCVALAVFLAGPAAAFENFESPPVHPIDLSPSGHLLHAVHQADHRLVVFAVNGGLPARIREIPVGLDPVSVRARTETEVWVVNHLSDSISIVDVETGHVVRTLAVGDEPTDVVFAGEPQRAFVSLSQEDRILVLDAAQPSLPGTSIPLEGSDPRSLAVSPDGSTVYLTIHESGNETTVIHFQTVDAMGGPPAPDPPLKSGLPQPPRNSLIVKYDGAAWRDDAGGDWSVAVPYTLSDQDVVAIDADALVVSDVWRGVGTHLFNVAVNPQTLELVVTNQEALNEIRFEPNLRGRFADTRLSVLDPQGGVTVRSLNPHIDRDVPGTDAVRATSISIPLDVVVDDAGQNVYVASFGSARVAVLDGAGNLTRTIDVGGGPAGLALDGDRLYVLERFESDLAWIDLRTDLVDRVSLGLDLTPADVREGRRLFYDAVNSSEHGDLSCATCHLFGGLDNVAWNLGDPQGDMIPVPPAADPFNNLPPFHPMKGPMTTQSLEALSGTGPFHWRGDKAVLADFNGAFVSLLGRDGELPAGDFALFEAFVFSLRYPPNPFRGIDDSYPPSIAGGDPALGEQLYLTGNLVGGLQCVSCHALPTGENGLIIPGPALLEDEAKVVPQLRNLYEKTRFDEDASVNVRGFGFTHDGAIDDLFTFLQFPAFTFANDQGRRDVAAFLLAFDTGTPPALGAQWTATEGVDGDGIVGTLQLQAEAGRVDLIAKGRGGDGRLRGWVYDGASGWTPDRVDAPVLTTGALLASAGLGTEITFTGVVPGEGHRLGIDRDLDGFLDGDERDAGSDPGDAASTPDLVATGVGDLVARSEVDLRVLDGIADQGASRIALRAAADAHARLDIFDLRGRRVRTLLDRGFAGGEQTLSWDLRDEAGSAVASGVYLVRFAAADRAISKRVLVVR